MDKLELVGHVIDSNRGQFKVQAGDLVVNCTLSGKIKMNNVRVLPGDRVTIEVGQYDTSRGRITYRHK